MRPLLLDPNLPHHRPVCDLVSKLETANLHLPYLGGGKFCQARLQGVEILASKNLLLGVACGDFI